MAAGERLTPYYGIIHRTEDWPDVLEEIPAIDAHGFLASSREPRLEVCPALSRTSQPQQAVFSVPLVRYRPTTRRTR